MGSHKRTSFDERVDEAKLRLALRMVGEYGDVQVFFHPVERTYALVRHGREGSHHEHVIELTEHDAAQVALLLTTQPEAME